MSEEQRCRKLTLTSYTKLPINSKYIKRLQRSLIYSDSDLIGDHYIAGKTGTSQVVGRELSKKSKKFQDHSVFTGYYPATKPRYAISVVVEHGGWGSKTALPVAKGILDQVKDL